MTRPFLFFLAIALILGGSIGGAFAGGVARGKTQSDESAASGLPTTVGPESQLGQAGLGLPQRDRLRQGNQSGDFSQQDLERLRQRFASGELGQQDLERLREEIRSRGLDPQDPGRAFPQFQGRTPRETGSRGNPGRTGAIEQVEDNTLTLSTGEGTVRATIGADTTIRRFTEATLADLDVGMRITLIGQPGDDGTVHALSIVVVPDDPEGFFGGGFTPRESRQGDGVLPSDGRPQRGSRAP